MVEGRRKAEWARAGTIAAAIYNTHRKRNSRVIRPGDFYRPLNQVASNFKSMVSKYKELSK